jgi:soluble P-type ATPase
MLKIDIPGFGSLALAHLVLDYNGTLAADGVLVPGVDQRLQRLSEKLRLHVITADTFGSVRNALSGLPCALHVLEADSQDRGKRLYIEQLGVEHTVSIGNGRNDCLMLRASALGIGVIGNEGAFSGIVTAADVVCNGIADALDLLLIPLRLTATLRS